MDKLCERGITVRNQSVLQRQVNDSVDTMTLLVRRLGYVNVHPYYVYMHDLVKGVEDLRTTLETGLDDREGRARRDGGLQHADVRRRRARAAAASATRTRTSTTTATTGVSVFTAPAVHPGEMYFYFDPIDLLPAEGKARWADPAEHQKMVEEARTIALTSHH